MTAMGTMIRAATLSVKVLPSSRSTAAATLAQSHPLALQPCKHPRWFNFINYFSKHSQFTTPNFSRMAAEPKPYCSDAWDCNNRCAAPCRRCPMGSPATCHIFHVGTSRIGSERVIFSTRCIMGRIITGATELGESASAAATAPLAPSTLSGCRCRGVLLLSAMTRAAFRTRCLTL
jgi:hypothetical protein